MEKSEKKAKTPRMIALIVLVCLLAAALLGTGAALIARRVTRGPVVYRYEDLRVREGVVRCLFAYYRAAIPVAYDEISDTPAYWSATVDGVSNGERWGEAALRGVRETIAAARLFDECGTLSESERERLRADLDEVYARAGGRDAYDELAAPLGFDHRDLESATLLLRKAALLADARWGEAGESVDAGALTTYLRDNYVCVRLIRVRVTDKMKKDEEGLYVLDGSLYVTESRTDEEQAAQRERADELRAALGLDAADPARLGGQDLDALWAAYNEDPAMADTRGVCYLSDGSAYTRAFGAVYPDVTAAALALGEGEATAVEEAGSVWIVCRVAPADEPWSDGANRDFFDDLRLRARASLTVALLTAERERVQTKSDAGPAAGDFAALSVETSLFPRR